MDSFLQIAPHSLAIVLCRLGAGEGAGTGAVSENDQLPRHHTGYEIFADFKAENSQEQLWNHRVTEALAETFFLGWIDEHVLLIQGKEDHLEVLREGWMRRCLNPPRGFTIKYLGDVSPISMSPISQSQFVPLGEVLLLAISAMNSAHRAVTQDALTEHLHTCFPGVPTPTDEVLHHTLNMLVRERKIYPTPEGYCIVTPQTYFITPSLIRTSSKWYQLEELTSEQRHKQQQTQCASPVSGAVTPSSSGGPKEKTYPKSNQNNCGGGDEPPSHHASLQRRSPKDHREAYSSPRSPSTPLQPAGGTTEKNRSSLGFPFKTDTLTRQRGGSTGTGGTTDGGNVTGSRKFGLKLFRLSFKKEKIKQLVTFSAQFPPEEWPLQDEETPSHLPRHIEIEIIRRVNPDLTVENLARHTAVMKRLEEERAQRTKALSANQSSRSRRSSSRHRKPSQTKLSRSHSKTRPYRLNSTDGCNLEPVDREFRSYSSSLARLPREQAIAIERQRARLAHSIPNILDPSHLPVAPEWDVSGELAKRRMEIPFPEPSHVPSAHYTKVHRSYSHTQERRSRNERSSKAKERSRSMDNSKGAGFIAQPDYYDDCNRYFTDNGTLRANQTLSSYTRGTPPTSRALGDCLGLDGNSLPNHSTKPITSSPPNDYFQCSGALEAVATSTQGTLGKSSHDGIKSCNADQQEDRQSSSEMKEDFQKSGSKSGSFPPLTLSAPTHEASSNQGNHHREIFSKDTLFKPLPDQPLTGHSLRGKSVGLCSTMSSSCDGLDSQNSFDAPKPLQALPSAPAQGIEPSTCTAECTFDYYNVSDDEEFENGAAKSRKEGEKPGTSASVLEEGAGTMQWVLEREKASDMQKCFEKNLTFASAKKNLQKLSQNQPSAHSARLDSMDSSSVTMDSGFNSPRTRESLASNTSSIVESSRRQNLAFSPGHLSIAAIPPFSFHAITEPAGSPADKLQKPGLASITSV